MNKRGQVYILSAIIVCMLAFLVVSKPNVIREQVLLQNFKGISNNYLTESPKVINEILGEDVILDDIKNELSSFTGDFVENYARNQDPNIGLIYIYNDENGMIVQNYLNDEKAIFTGSSGSGNIILSYDEMISGDISFEGTNTDLTALGSLCDSNENYCLFERDQLPTSGTYILKIGDIDYTFDLDPNSPELIVIIKSQDENTIKVDINENELQE